MTVWINLRHLFQALQLRAQRFVSIIQVHVWIIYKKFLSLLNGESSITIIVLEKSVIGKFFLHDILTNLAVRVRCCDARMREEIFVPLESKIIKINMYIFPVPFPTFPPGLLP